jgi:hypothetical protein
MASAVTMTLDCIRHLLSGTNVNAVACEHFCGTHNATSFCGWIPIQPLSQWPAATASACRG